jgi:hypothetical protein
MAGMGKETGKATWGRGSSTNSSSPSSVDLGSLTILMKLLRKVNGNQYGMYIISEQPCPS